MPRTKETPLEFLTAMMEVYCTDGLPLQEIIGYVIGDKYRADLTEAECVLVGKEICRLDDAARAVRGSEWRKKLREESAAEIQAMFN